MTNSKRLTLSARLTALESLPLMEYQKHVKEAAELREMLTQQHYCCILIAVNNNQHNRERLRWTGRV